MLFTVQADEVGEADTMADCKLISRNINEKIWGQAEPKTIALQERGNFDATALSSFPIFGAVCAPEVCFP